METEDNIENLLGLDTIFAIVDKFTNTNTIKSKTVNSPITSNDDFENTETPTSNSGGSLLSCVAIELVGDGSTLFAGESDISTSNDLEDNDIIIENEEDKLDKLDKFFESELDSSQQSEMEISRIRSQFTNEITNK